MEADMTAVCHLGQRPGAGSRLALVLCALVAGMGGCPPQPCDPRLAEAARQQAVAMRDDSPPLTAEVDLGLARLADWAALPTLGKSRYEQFSSYNRAPGAFPIETGGKDFNNFIALSGPDQPLLLADVEGPDPDGRRLGGYVLASVDDGPGYVARMFFTRFSVSDLLRGYEFFASNDLGRFSNEVLRIYVDDLSQPAFVIPLADVGVTEPFALPFAGRSASAVVCYTPIAFTQRLRVVMDGLCPLNGYYYHVGVQRTDAPTRAFSPRLADDPQYAAARALLEVFGQNPQANGARVLNAVPFEFPPQTTTAIFEDAAAGTIVLLQFAFDTVTQSQLTGLHLRMYFDGAATPAVDVPLDAFCGGREQLASFKTLPLCVDRKGKRLTVSWYLPMPYAEHARLELQNNGSQTLALRASVAVDRTLPPKPWGYLHARFTAVEGPQPTGSQFEVLGVDGRGRYVGTFLFAAGRRDTRPQELPAALNILEGNELGIIDGEVRIRGTGTEDYYNGGFYFAAGPFSQPFAAANFVQGGFNQEVGIVSCCRWHVLSDAIDFQRSFELRFQYGADTPAVVVRYATVAYYYLDRPD
jgi:hypothetical protein